MKKILIGLSLIAGIAFAGDIEYAVNVSSNTPTAVLPPCFRPATSSIWYANTAVTNGTVLKVKDTGVFYFVLTTGTTSTNTAPSVTSGMETNGTAVLIAINKSGRKKALITQEANADLWYQTGTTCTTNGGEFAFLKAQQYRTDSDDMVWVYSTSDVKLNVIDK
jgi:hypothetical protein